MRAKVVVFDGLGGQVGSEGRVAHPVDVASPTALELESLVFREGVLAHLAHQLHTFDQKGNDVRLQQAHECYRVELVHTQDRLAGDTVLSATQAIARAHTHTHT